MPNEHDTGRAAGGRVPLEPGERLVGSSAAYLYDNYPYCIPREGVPGTVSVTSQRIIFESHIDPSSFLGKLAMARAGAKVGATFAVPMNVIASAELAQGNATDPDSTLSFLLSRNRMIEVILIRAKGQDEPLCFGGMKDHASIVRLIQEQLSSHVVHLEF